MSAGWIVACSHFASNTRGGSRCARVEKSTFTPAYAALREKLVAMRKAAGLTQRALAREIRREHSFVARIEQGERRLDVVEFFWVCRACGADPELAARDVMREIASLERSRRKRAGRRSLR